MTTHADKERVRAALIAGTLFEGKYRIEQHIGAGSFAYVVKARHEVMDREVAIKVLKPEIVAAHPDVADRFVHEARIVSKLRHPNTVTVFDFGTTDSGLSYMVMEFVEGKPLDEVIIRDGSLSPRRVVRITKQILKSLDEAHSAGIVHRDLKPTNIMLTEVHGETDFVKVLDFGVAKLIGEGDKPNTGFERRSTQFVGTPIYMSPEQVLGDTVGPASDLYALGLIVYEMLTGDDPIDAQNVAAVAQIHVDEAPIPFANLDALSTRFQKLILKATQRRPENRFRTVAEFARQLPSVEGDHSAEFSGLLGKEGDQRQASSGGLGNEISESSWEIFAGRNYVAPPEEKEVQSPRPKRRRAPAPARVEEKPQRPSPQRDLQLDVGKLKRDEIRRERGKTGGVSASEVWSRKADPLRDGLWLVGGVLAFLVSFVIASTVFVASAGSGRALVGLLPLGAALVATWVSPTRRLGGGALASMVLPLARHMVIALGLLVLLVALVMPESAASALDLDGDWFLQGTADAGAVRSAVDALNALLSGLFSFASRVIPW